MATVEYEMLKELFDEKLDRLHDLQVQTLEQAKKTNGRVNSLEKETETIRFATKNRVVLVVIISLLSSTPISQVVSLLAEANITP